MKYIVFEKRLKTLTLSVPIVFPAMLVHRQVADALTAKDAPLDGYMPVAAGEYTPMSGECSGESETLAMRSRGVIDERIIMMNDYGAGYS